MIKKKIILLILLFIIGGIILPSDVSAGTYTGNDKEVYYRGFVPCGKEVCVSKGTTLNERELERLMKEENESFKEACEDGSVNGNLTVVYCQFCHFFIMLNGIVSYVLINIIPPLAILMLVIGGVMFYFGGTSTKVLERAKLIIRGVVIGIALIYGAYMIVGIFLSVLGVSEWTGLASWAEQGPFSIKCEIELPK